MIPHNRPTLGKDEIAAANRVIDSCNVAQGVEVAEFENEFCEFMNIPEGHAVALSSGTAALFMALNTIGSAGKRVSIPALSCSSLRHAVNMAQGSEVIVDCAAGNLSVDMDQIAREKTDFAIVPHMFGLPVKLNKFDGKHVIEDCAQAMGALVNNVPVGLQSEASIFSFYATKLITTGGQGGMFVSRNLDLAEAVRDYREFDCRRDARFRFNFQLTDLQAAVGRVQLKRFPEFIALRDEIYDRYIAAGLQIIDQYKSTDHLKPVRYRCLVRAPDAKQHSKLLENFGVKAIVPVEQWELLGPALEYPVANFWTHNLISLPMYPSLTIAEQRHVIKSVHKSIDILKK